MPRQIRIPIAITFSIASFGLFVLSFAAPPTTGGGGEPNDPDLPPGARSIDKETYLNLRNEWVMERRGFVKGRPFDPGARDRAIEQMGRQLKDLEAARSGHEINTPGVVTPEWIPVGPAPIPNGQTVDSSGAVSGRVISIAIHPENPNVVFVGTESGGLYRTTDGGTIWRPLFDTVQLQESGLAALGTLAIGAIAIAPSNPNIVYVGTGARRFFGSGLYRIDDAMQTQPTHIVGPINPSRDYGTGNLTPTFTFRAISKILVHPTDSATIFVSTTFAGVNQSEAGLLGIYRSTNATDPCATAPCNNIVFDKLWVNGPGRFKQTEVTDMVLNPNDPEVLIAWVKNGGGRDDSCLTDCAGIYVTADALGNGAFGQTLFALNGGVRGKLAIKTGTVTTVLAATEEDPAEAPNSNPKGCLKSELGLLRRSIGGFDWPDTDAINAGDGGLLRDGDGFCGSQCFSRYWCRDRP